MLNILKLLVLVPFLLFLCVLIGGQYWWVYTILALVVGYFWFREEEKVKNRKKYLEAQVAATRKNMLEAQAEAERLQRKADIQEAVKQGVEEAQGKSVVPQWLKGQWN